MASGQQERDSLFPLRGVSHPHDRGRPQSRSRRVLARHNRASYTNAVSNNAISALNDLASSATNPSLRPSFASESLASQRMTAHVRQCAASFVSRPSFGVCGDAFTSSRWKEDLALQDVLPAAAYGSSRPTTAVPLVADLVALPDAAGRVDITQHLPPHVAAYYSTPNACLRVPAPPLPGAPRPPRLPQPRVYAERKEYVALVKKMLSCGMVTLTAVKPRVINGLFGVAKPDGKIRLIIDARHANRIFAEPPHVELPTPTLLGNMEAPPDRKLYVAKCDLSDFFYRFRIPLWMQQFFGLPSLTAAELGLQHVHGASAVLWPMFTCVAMGWSHSVYLTQTAHEHILDTSTRLKRRDRITATSDLRIDRLRHLIYIDDLNIFGTVRDEVKAALVEYIAVTDARDLPAKPSKIQWPSCEGVECIGIDVDGTKHTAGVRFEKLHALCAATQRLLLDRRVSGLELAGLVGRWTWAMLVNRPALAAFCAVYRFIEFAGPNTFCLWPSAVRELVMAINLAPLLHVSVAAAWFDRVLACDASLLGQGVCAARVHPSFVQLAAQHAGIDRRREVHVEAAIDAPLITTPWTTIVSAPWRAPEHINSLELRSANTALRWVLSSPIAIRRRLLLLSDSQVAVGALSKGRSSSFIILCRLRSMSALLLASGIRLFTRWIPSHINPADGPSRSCRPHRDRDPF